jgi:transcriptional regulator with XRE-family HTH domain
MKEKYMDTKNNKRKFPQTKQLIRIALNAGMTQDEIAKSCRTQQSIVSKWLHGGSNAAYGQIKPLLELYGNLLSQKTARLYYQTSQEENIPRYFRVEGNIIFSHIVYNGREKMLRYIVHDQNNSFVLVRQVRRHTAMEIKIEKKEEIENGKESSVPRNERRFLSKTDESSKHTWYKVAVIKKYIESGSAGFSIENDKANWNTVSIINNLSRDDLVTEIDATAEELAADGFYQDGVALPFLLREAFYEHGYTTDDVENFEISCYK